VRHLRKTGHRLVLCLLLAAAACRGRPSAPVDANIFVILATYGYNCGATPGNAMNSVVKRCSRNLNCEYTVDQSELGDPAPGCAKNFIVNYKCFQGARERRVVVDAEASGSVASLTCQ
jgi:hypothetical protein